MKLLLLLSSVLFFFSCRNDAEVVKPAVTSITESVYASGIIKSKNQYEAFLPVNGVISEIFLHEGDSVKKGTPILSVRNEIQKLNRVNAELASEFSSVNTNADKLNEAKQNLELARARLTNDSTLFFRQKKLWDQQIGSKVELENRELAYKNSRTLFYSAEVRYRDLKRQIEYNAAQSANNKIIASTSESDFILKSEIDGQLFQLNREVGETVGPQTALAVIGDSKNYILELQVDENDITRIKSGLKVYVTMDAYPGKVFDAEVTSIKPLMNERSKSFVVEAEFVNGPEILYPNISFEANIVVQIKNDALLVPRSFMLNDSVVIKSSGDTVLVKTGLKDYRNMEILSGLSREDELLKPNK